VDAFTCDQREMRALMVGPIIVAPLTRKVLMDDPQVVARTTDMTDFQYRFVYRLACSAETTVSIADLKKAIWSDQNHALSDNALQVLAYRIRKKMNEVSKNSSAYLKNMRGRGYKLTALKGL
jgi:DNA-binding response OmpR family regulator